MALATDFYFVNTLKQTKASCMLVMYFTEVGVLLQAATSLVVAVFVKFCSAVHTGRPFSHSNCYHFSERR